MGLDVVSFNVQNFTDSNGVIDDLGIDNISQIKEKGSDCKRLRQKKEIAVAKAEADRQSNDARINSKERSPSRTTSWICRRQGSFRKTRQQAGGSGCGIWEIQKENSEDHRNNCGKCQHCEKRNVWYS